jgi:hypothetical protein
MIQHLLRKHKQEYIVDIKTIQKVIILMLYFKYFQIWIERAFVFVIAQVACDLKGVTESQPGQQFVTPISEKLKAE